jgi:serine/threonine protein kinase
MDTADLNIMSQPPFDPTADVRITHTVRQGRADGVDRNSAGGGLILNHYLRGPSVGKGQHGTVYKCWDLAQNSVEVVRLTISSSFPLFSFLSLSHHTFSPPPHHSSTSPFMFYVSLHVCDHSACKAIKVVSRHNPRADRLNQLKRKRIPRSGPHLPVTDNLGSQEYKIRKEIAVMKLCRHPHVVRLLEVIDDKLYQKVYMGQSPSLPIVSMRLAFAPRA